MRAILSFAFTGAASARDVRVSASDHGFTLDRLGDVRQIGLRARSLPPPSPYSFFELGGALAESAHLRGTPGVTYQ
jgi:hypothetical protein